MKPRYYSPLLSWLHDPSPDLQAMVGQVVSAEAKKGHHPQDQDQDGKVEWKINLILRDP